jgi:hypothetical protein
MAGAGLFWEKSTASWLLVAGLLWEKSTAGWWLIRQANRAQVAAAFDSAVDPCRWKSWYIEFRLDRINFRSSRQQVPTHAFDVTTTDRCVHGSISKLALEAASSRPTAQVVVGRSRPRTVRFLAMDFQFDTAIMRPAGRTWIQCDDRWWIMDTGGAKQQPLALQTWAVGYTILGSETSWNG